MPKLIVHTATGVEEYEVTGDIVVNADGTVEQPDPQPEPEPQPQPERPTETLINTISSAINVRPHPTTKTTIERSLAPGGSIDLFTDFETEADGFVWHETAGGFYIAVGPVGEPPWLVREDEPEPVVDTNTVQLSPESRFRLAETDKGWLLEGLQGLGVNNRSLAFWPTGVMPHVNASDQVWWLDQMQALGVNNIRVYFSHRDVGFGQQLGLFETVLALARERDINVVLVVTDALGRSGFTMQPDLEWHNQIDNYLNIDWYAERYKVHYMPRLKAIVESFNKYDNLVIDLMNEPAIINADLNEEHFHRFQAMFADASRQVHEWSGGTIPVTIGLISVPDLWTSPSQAATAVRFYEGLPHVHIASAHAYLKHGMPADALFQHEQRINTSDWPAADATGKAKLWGEAGVSELFGGTRPAALDAFLERQYNEYGVTSVMQWGVDPNPNRDRGYSDEFAIALHRDGDYQSSVDVLKQVA